MMIGKKNYQKTVLMEGFSQEFELYPLLGAEHHLDPIIFFYPDQRLSDGILWQ